MAKEIDFIEEAMKRDIPPNILADISSRVKGDKAALWTILQGFPVTHDQKAEYIDQFVRDVAAQHGKYVK